MKQEACDSVHKRWVQEIELRPYDSRAPGALLISV